MSNMSNHLRIVFKDAFDRLRSGELKTLIPFLSLFKLNGKPMNLKLHYQFSPFYNCVQPPHMVAMTGRQVGKSYAIDSDCALRNMLIPFYHTLIVQPRADQIQRLIGTVYKPLLASCPIWEQFITSAELQKMSLRQFKNGSLCYAEHMFESPDRIRGISGIASTTFDECLLSTCNITLYDFKNAKFYRKKVGEIKKGELIFSFANDAAHAILSVVAKDASPRGIKDCYKITTKSGRTITVTEGHCLHTAVGRKTVAEIIEHEHRRRTQIGQLIRTSTECCDGKPVGGCLLPVGEQDRGRYSMESWLLPEPVCPAQIHGIIRVRDKRTAEEAESRLRRLLVGIDSSVPWDVSLLVCPAAPSWGKEENNNIGISKQHNSPDSAGLVVHGRRKQAEGDKQWLYMHKWLLIRRGYASSCLVEGKVANHLIPVFCETPQREPRSSAESTSYRLYTYDAINCSIHSRLHEIQDRDSYEYLSCMRGAVSEKSEKAVLTQLRSYTQQISKGNMETGAFGEHEKSQCGLERTAQGGDQRCSQEAPREPDAGEKGAASRICPPVQRQEQGRAEHIQEAVAPVVEAGSGIPGEAEAGKGCVLCKAEGGSGKVREEAGAPESQKEDRCGAGTRQAVSEEAQGGNPPEGSGDAGRIQQATGASAGAGKHDGTGKAAARQGTVAGELPQEEVGDDSRGMGCQECQDTGNSQKAHGSHKGGSGEAGEVEGRREASQGCTEGEETATDTAAPVTDRWAREYTDDTVLSYEQIASIEYVGKHNVCDIEVVGTHNYILASGICSYNCQDLEYEYLDIASEVMSASLFWGFNRYTGTPKTTDTTLALLWNRSSQAEWVMRCGHCGHFNVPNPEHDLLKMIGKSGPVCAKCGGSIYPKDGGYVHALPDRALSFPGYHISQTVHPLHMINQSKWNKLLYKIDTYPELTLYNEVFGWPYDAATSPLTMADLKKATHGLKVASITDFEKIADQYSYITVAVDWSGGGMISDSYTAYAIMGLRQGSDIIDVIYGRRIPKGVSPTEEAREILSWISSTGADAFAYDNGGAGFARLEIMNHEGLHNIPGLTIVPINYVRPHAGDVMVPRTGQRESDLYYYTLDKSRSLAICVMSIKACRLRVPDFLEEDDDAYQRDLLALREDPRVSLGNETVILIIKKPGVPDDFAHAVNFGASQIWDHFGAYPRIGTRYDASILDFDENHNRILDDDAFGPRGDFDRFKEAVNQRADVIEPEMLW